jgi:predicted transcriptional regulator
MKRGPKESIWVHRESARRMANNGLSQREIAAALDLSQSSVNRLLNATPEESGDVMTILQRRMHDHNVKVGLE